MIPVVVAVSVAAVAVSVLLAVRSALKFPHAPLDHVKIVSPFGPRATIVSAGRTIPARFHAGVDLRALTPLPFYAVADGRIELVERAGPGVGTIVHHRLSSSLIGPLAGARVKYVHVGRVDVARGDVVVAGQTLGLTGDAEGTVDPHLHLELKLAGAAGATDPAPYL